jgi:teichuronic acid biosynthesis glycosyltransferase TuaC
VDCEKFRPVDRSEARRALALSDNALVLVTVGGLTERKGFHRVIELLPALRRRFPGLVYLAVGGASAEGDWGPRLRQMVTDLALKDAVRFLGPVKPDQLRVPLSAADVFVLATRNEGWANVFLEAMACGLPVVATDVGGNAEVIRGTELGRLVPAGDPAALEAALDDALRTKWDHGRIIAYARNNDWEKRVQQLVEVFRCIASRTGREGTTLACDSECALK